MSDRLAATRPIRVAIVTNIPAPYRLPVYESLGRQPGLAIKVIFCSGREPDRAWDLADLRFDHDFLKQRFVTVAGRYIHVNFDVTAALDDWGPDVVVTTGFNPTHLLAYAWARRRRALHVAMTDGTARSEQSLSPVHRAIRRHVYARTAAFVGASEGSFQLYREYGMRPSAMFKSHLCADNRRFELGSSHPRDVHLMFCGRFVEIKQPLFALKVACEAARRLGRPLKMLFVGSGELDSPLRQAAAGCADLVTCEFAGFAQQASLPSHYARAQLLLFPTLGDTWGVVANEACAAGVPVLTTPAAGVAGELVVDRESGRVLELAVSDWADATAELLADEELRDRMGQRARELVQPYTYQNAAHGLQAAIHHALRTRASQWYRRAHCAAITPQRYRPRVVMVQRRLSRQREPLFERLRTLLAEQGVELAVVGADPLPPEPLQGADLAILPQDDRTLLRLMRALRRGNVPVALWGHGHCQASTAARGLGEWWRRRELRHAVWWFACSEAARDRVKAAGLPGERITVLENAGYGEAVPLDESGIESIAGRLCDGIVRALRGAPAWTPDGLAPPVEATA